jgi:poly(hydroxyalkanoate) depolymerase family esterase
MKFDLSRAMREAAELTRTQRLPEAMRVIQHALGASRRDGEASPTASEPAVDTPLGDPASVGRERTRWRGTSRPLAETIKALRLAPLRAMPTRQPASNAPPVADGAQFVARSFVGNQGERAYKLYLPSRAPAGLPLVVMLHGCTQTPDDFAIGTRMNALAEEIGFVVAYPRQSRTANPSLCWNWFQPHDTARGAGEAAIIAGITQRIVEEYALDSRRVFVAGMSAGAAMAAVVATEYPDIYAAVGMHSGLAAGSATDLISALAAMRGDHGMSPSRAYAPRTRTIVFQGMADTTVHPSNGERVGQFTLRNGDASETTRATSGGRLVTRTIARDQQGNVWLEQWLIESAGHAWSGGDPSGSFTDSAGPDASREMLRYFLETPEAS